MPRTEPSASSDDGAGAGNWGGQGAGGAAAPDSYLPPSYDASKAPPQFSCDTAPPPAYLELFPDGKVWSVQSTKRAPDKYLIWAFIDFFL